MYASLGDDRWRQAVWCGVGSSGSLCVDLDRAGGKGIEHASCSSTVVEESCVDVILAFRQVLGQEDSLRSVDDDLAGWPRRRGLGRFVIGIKAEVFAALGRFEVEENSVVGRSQSPAAVAKLEGDSNGVTGANIARGEFSVDQFGLERGRRFLGPAGGDGQQ